MSHSGRARAAVLATLAAAAVMLSPGCGKRPAKGGKPAGGAEAAPTAQKAPPPSETPGAKPEEKAGPEEKPGKEQEAAHLTADGFEKSIAKGVALVDFWADWCPPCRKQGPIVDKLASEYRGKALVGKVNVEEARGLAGKLRIEAIPTLVVFKDGKEVRRLVGLNSEEDLRAALEGALEGN